MSYGNDYGSDLEEPIYGSSKGRHHSFQDSGERYGASYGDHSYDWIEADDPDFDKDGTTGPSFMNSRGIKIATRRFVPPSPPKGILFYLHGKYIKLRF